MIVPTYNRAAFLPACIDSILGAGIPDVELVVVDDGSTDGTPGLLARYGDRVRYLRQDNAGPSTARNRGMRGSTGRYIAFLDSDDTFIPGVHAKMLRFLDHELQADAIFADVLVADPSGRSSRGHARPVFDEFRQARTNGLPAGISMLDQDRFVRYQVIRQNTVLAQTAVVRRSLVEKAGGFDEALTGYEEWEFFTRLATRGRFAYLDEPCAVIEKHGGNLSADLEGMVGNGVVIRRKYLGPEFDLPLPVRRGARKAFGRVYLDWCQYPFRRNEMAEARRRLSQLVGEVGPSPTALIYWCASWLPASTLGWVRSVRRTLRG